MKTVSILIVGIILGLVIGVTLLWQVQEVASDNAMECLKNYSVAEHRQFCKNDVRLMEFVYNVNK